MRRQEVRQMLFFLGALTLCSLLSLISFVNAFSAVIHVPADQPTIQAGVNAAAAGDTVLVADGIYSGEGNIDIWLKGKVLTVRSENGPENCIIEGDGKRPAFNFGKHVSGSVLRGFTIKNAKPGIYCTMSSPTIRACIITENKGGAIRLINGSFPTIRECTITENRGIAIQIIKGSSPTIMNCAITRNRAITNAAIKCSKTKYYPLTVINSLIADNSGAGIGLDYSKAVIMNCTITGNRSKYVGGLAHFLSEVTITNSIIWGNSPQDIRFYHGLPTVTYSDIGSGWKVGKGEGNISQDPQFVDSENGDYHLLFSSPAVNSGSNQAVKASGVKKDIVGNRRIIHRIVDMGPYELQ